MDEKITNIKERILQIAKNKGIKYESFFDELGLSYGNFKGEAKKTALNSDSIAIILTKYDDVDPIWLLTGEGEMLKSSTNVSNIGSGNVVNTGSVGGHVVNSSSTKGSHNNYGNDKQPLFEKIEYLEKLIEQKDELLKAKDKIIELLTK